MYNHAPDDYICPFCILARGVENEHVYSSQRDVVYQDDDVTALIASHQWPNNRGHVIIIPNEHFENIYDLPAKLGARIHELAREIALAMKAAYSCDGTSTRQHNEPAGNQDVWHYHLHVFPRYKNDKLYISKRERLSADERAEYAQKLRTYIVTGERMSDRRVP
jgi:histidine triad (HIT) family protein